jgi:hypothetical protein
MNHIIILSVSSLFSNSFFSDDLLRPRYVLSHLAFSKKNYQYDKSCNVARKLWKINYARCSSLPKEISQTGLPVLKRSIPKTSTKTNSKKFFFSIKQGWNEWKCSLRYNVHVFLCIFSIFTPVEIHILFLSVLY